MEDDDDWSEMACGKRLKLAQGMGNTQGTLTCFDHCGSWYGEYCTVEVLMYLCLELYWYCC